LGGARLEGRPGRAGLAAGGTGIDADGVVDGLCFRRMNLFGEGLGLLRSGLSL
jgi:hypothetical protein